MVTRVHDHTPIGLVTVTRGHVIRTKPELTVSQFERANRCSDWDAAVLRSDLYTQGFHRFNDSTLVVVVLQQVAA